MINNCLQQLEITYERVYHELQDVDAGQHLRYFDAYLLPPDPVVQASHKQTTSCWILGTSRLRRTARTIWMKPFQDLLE
jgi:hypothetical protein